MKNMGLSTVMTGPTISRSDAARNETVDLLPPFVEVNAASCLFLEFQAQNVLLISFLSVHYLVLVVVNFRNFAGLNDS